MDEVDLIGHQPVRLSVNGPGGVGSSTSNFTESWKACGARDYKE